MKEICVFLADGFEEIEAITPIDILRRGELPVKTVSIMSTKTVMGAHGVPLIADITLRELKEEDVEMIVLPGGLPGAFHLAENEQLGELVTKFVKAGKPVAAICAAPIVLGRRGLLEGKTATCYPGMEEELIGAHCTGAMVEKADHLIFGKGPAAAAAFAFAILERYADASVVAGLKKGMLWE